MGGVNPRLLLLAAVCMLCACVRGVSFTFIVVCVNRHRLSHSCRHGVGVTNPPCSMPHTWSCMILTLRLSPPSPSSTAWPSVARAGNGDAPVPKLGPPHAAGRRGRGQQ